jgi:hypothetical protein
MPEFSRCVDLNHRPPGHFSQPSIIIATQYIYLSHPAFYIAATEDGKYHLRGLIVGISKQVESRYV